MFSSSLVLAKRKEFYTQYDFVDKKRAIDILAYIYFVFDVTLSFQIDHEILSL